MSVSSSARIFVGARRFFDALFEELVDLFFSDEVAWHGVTQPHAGDFRQCGGDAGHLPAERFRSRIGLGAGKGREEQNSEKEGDARRGHLYQHNARYNGGSNR